jgi:riboflavin synthase alpha subunit
LTKQLKKKPGKLEDGRQRQSGKSHENGRPTGRPYVYNVIELEPALSQKKLVEAGFILLSMTSTKQHHHRKGSITVNGVSLTVVVRKNQFSVAIITLMNTPTLTPLSRYENKSRFDIGKYVSKLYSSKL